jgi:hypothetical protein
MSNPGGDERPPVPSDDLFAAGDPPPVVPAYEPAELRDPTPEYDALAEASVSPLVVESTDFSRDEAEAVTGDADYHLAPNPGAASPLDTVKRFAAQQPAAFLGAALVLGWLVGKVFSSSDDDE